MPAPSRENPATEKCEHSEGLSLEYFFFWGQIFFVQGHVEKTYFQGIFFEEVLGEV